MDRPTDTPAGQPRPEAVLAAFGVGGSAVDMVPMDRAWSNRLYRPRDDGCSAWVETSDGSEAVPARLHRWVEGPPAPLEPVDPAVAQWAGRLLATLHGFAIRPRDRSLFPVPNTDTADRWPDLVAAAHRHGAS